MVARSDSLGGDTTFLHMDTRQPVKRLGVATREILRMFRWVYGNVLAKRETN
jgi:hypothetical protein